MSTKTIEQFFTGKTLEIPSYQRDYAWHTNNVDDLFDDILEAMEIGGGHYLGTFILSAGCTRDRFKVVDGQQRLTTLTILFDAMVDALPDSEIKTYYRSTFLRHPVNGPKFSVLGSNQEFFSALLDEKNPVPDSAGQRRLLSAYDWIRQRVQGIKNSGGDRAIQNWLANIGKLEVLEFIEPNEGKAIRMFQSVNDRGVPLSKMDIAKSLLIYYSNRFLDGRLDAFISEKFGTAFRNYSVMKGFAAEDGFNIRLINRSSFHEDDIFRYHYFAFDAEENDAVAQFDYNATSETVLENFLKPTLKNLRNQPERLELFIQAYVSDLAEFFATLKNLVSETRTDKELFLLFVVEDLAATMYPLMVRLAMRNALHERISGPSNLTLLQIIEIVDLRVFKLRGTNPQSDILWLARKSSGMPLDEITSYLKWFVGRFMDNGLFESRLSQENVYRNPGLVRILCAIEENKRLELCMPELSVTDLAELVRKGQTVEHILPQTPSFGVKAYGFRSKDIYTANIDRIGNLTLLESGLNSLCSNNSVETKFDDKTMYRASTYRMTKAIAAGVRNTPVFSNDDIESRSVELAKFCVFKWPIW